jgi:hypothetical protein
MSTWRRSGLRVPRGMDLLTVVALLLVTVHAPGAAQGKVAMQDLTMAQDRLPGGCSLKTIEPAHQEVVATPEPGRQKISFIGPTPSMQPPGIAANPWMGTDRKILAWLRGGIDGPRLGPPDAWWFSESPAVALQRANGVEEGYAATYAQSGSRDLGVWAVRFALAPETHLDFPQNTHSTRPATVITMGLIRVALFGDGGACSTAVETYLRSLGK